MTTPIEQVKVAITALSNPSETATANQWLVAFERSVDSWTAAEQLLRETDSQCRFFGAKFLYSKVQRDFLQLNESTIPSLVHTMVQHIIRFAGESTVDMKVCRYLCLALAALAVQINQEGIVTQILLWFNPIVTTNPRVLLELLVVLPEECYNRQVDVAVDIRDKFAEQLSASVGEVFGFLHLLSDGRNLSAGGNGNIATVNDATINVILRCLEKWIDYINFSGSSLAAHPLFLYALECLSRESSFDAATQVVIATMQKFRCREPTILNLVTPRIFALRELWTAQVQQLNEDSDVDDMSVCRSLCRLFTETAEACLEVIRDDNNTALDQLVFQLVQCSQFRYDHSIARIPLIFFMEAEDRQLSDFMRSSDKLYERYLPAFVALYDTSLSQLALPADVIIGNNPSMADEVADARIDWRNTVIDCCKVLGPTTCLQRACMVLQEHLQAIQQRGQQSNPGNVAVASGPTPLTASMGTALQWTRVEASLFCIQTVVQHAPNENNPLFPQLMSFIGSLPSDLNSLNATVVGLIGGFSQWLSRNDSFLPPMLTQLYSSLQADNLQTSAAAAKAIMRVFIACAGVVTLPFSELHTIMQSMRQSNKLDLESDLLLLEGFCVVVSKLPSHSSKKASFACIVEPIALTLANSISLNPPPAASFVSADIDRLTTCFRYIIMDGAIVAELFAQVQPLLLRVLEVYACKESICEKVCRCYKHSIRSARRGFIPLLPAMTVHLADQFQKTPLAAFLYAGAICFSDYSREDGGVHVQTLYTMVGINEAPRSYCLSLSFVVF